MNYIELFLLSMSAITTGLKIGSDTIAWQWQQNYDGSTFCATLVQLWVGLEALYLMELASKLSKILNSFGGWSKGKGCRHDLMISGLSRVEDAF
jgi:hypothetical protein